MHRKDVVIDRSAITTAIITDDPWIWLRGVRAPGTYLPGRLAYGTWRNLAGRDFVLARRRRAAVVIDVDVPEEAEEGRGRIRGFDDYSRIIISTAHAVGLVQALHAPGDASEVFTTDTTE